MNSATVLKESADKYEAMLASDPSSRAFAPLAELYRKLGRLEEALALCRDGIRKHPDYSGAQILLARILMDLKRFREAEQELTALIRRVANHLLAHQILARLYLQIGQLQHAKTIAARILKLQPEDATAKAILAKKTPATEAGAAALHSPTPTVTMARLYEEQGHLQQALEIYEKIAAAQPELQSEVMRLQQRIRRDKKVDALQAMLKKFQQAKKPA